MFEYSENTNWWNLWYNGCKRSEYNEYFINKTWPNKLECSKKVMGRCDEPLNDKGKEQAKETSDNLKDTNIDLIICSPLKRAKQTAEIINENRNIPIIYDERIIERDFGEFEGNETKVFDFHGYWNYYRNDEYQQAENIQLFFKRIYDFLDDIVEKYKDKNILIVAHGGVSIPVACYFKKEIPEGLLIDAGLVLGNCQVASYSVDNKIKTK